MLWDGRGGVWRKKGKKGGGNRIDYIVSEVEGTKGGGCDIEQKVWRKDVGSRGDGESTDQEAVQQRRGALTSPIKIESMSLRFTAVDLCVLEKTTVLRLMSLL